MIFWVSSAASIDLVQNSRENLSRFALEFNEVENFRDLIKTAKQHVAITVTVIYVFKDANGITLDIEKDSELFYMMDPRLLCLAL